MIISFVFSIFILIILPSFPLVILGWDLLGITSFLLVIFYPSKISNRAGIITLLINRLGDIFLILGIRIFFNLSSVNLLIGGFIFFCLITKSAHFPLSSWLPAAIIAPTPISALVHSSTLVTAGIYFIIRYNEILVINYLIISFILIARLLTCILGRLLANFEIDGKKVVAFSTLSQLGFIIIRAIACNYLLCFFHLLTHAIFKSLLFIFFGLIIHTFTHSQIASRIFLFWNRIYNKKIKDLTIFSIIGFPFLCGFYSKDLILENIRNTNLKLIFNLFFWLRISLTCRYSFRLIYFNANLIKKISFFTGVEIDFFIKYSNYFMRLIIIGIRRYLLCDFLFYFPPYNKIITIILIFLGFFIYKNLQSYLKITKDYEFFSINILVSLFNKNYFLSRKRLYRISEIGWNEKLIFSYPVFFPSITTFNFKNFIILFIPLFFIILFLYFL